MKRLLFAFFLSVLALLRTDGFHPSLIKAPLLAIESSVDCPEILSQPFHYLGKGRQSFVFESEDGKWVIKFFNKKYIAMPWYSFFCFDKEKTKRERRKFFYENSYQIAYRELGEEICAPHLGHSIEPLPPVVFTSRTGTEFAPDLNELPFILQKKGTPFYPTLDAIYQKEGLLGLKREIDHFVDAVALRIGKGIADSDHDVEHNWGYVEGRLFRLDPGRFYYDETLGEPERLKKEWHTATHSFSKWLQKKYPEAALYLQESVGCTSYVSNTCILEEG